MNKLQTIREKFSTEAECMTYLASLKWSKGYTCPKCGHSEYKKGRTQYYRRCKSCFYDESCTAGTWNISKVTNMRSMFTGDTMCTINYDNLLNGWAGQTVASGLNFDGGYSQYSSAGSSARATLVNNDGWTITDGGLNPDNTQCYKSLVTGLETITVSQAVGIYPNPSTVQLTISGKEALGNIIIYTSIGTIVYQTTAIGLEQIVDISNNDPGLYFVKVGNQTTKLVKE